MSTGCRVLEDSRVIMSRKTTTLSLLLILVLVTLLMCTPIRAHAQSSTLNVYIQGGSGNCYFKENEGVYGWSWCPSSPLNGEYISCSCVNINGSTYSMYRLLANVNAVITIAQSSNIVFNGQSHIVDGGNSEANGINIYSASNIIIENITVKNFRGAGVYVDQASNIIVRYSSLEFNNIGVSIGGSVGNIAIFNNDIKSNTIGVSLASSTVTLCLNNFVRNPNDVKVSANWVTATWYCRIGNQYVGNYWEGVSDPDQCRARGDIDGVCKIVYENNIDFYPNVKPVPVPVPEPLVIPFIVLVVLPMLLFWRRIWPRSVEVYN